MILPTISSSLLFYGGYIVHISLERLHFRSAVLNGFEWLSLHQSQISRLYRKHVTIAYRFGLVGIIRRCLKFTGHCCTTRWHPSPQFAFNQMQRFLSMLLHALCQSTFVNNYNGLLYFCWQHKHFLFVCMCTLLRVELFFHSLHSCTNIQRLKFRSTKHEKIFIQSNSSDGQSCDT